MKKMPYSWHSKTSTSNEYKSLNTSILLGKIVHCVEKLTATPV